MSIILTEPAVNEVKKIMSDKEVAAGTFLRMAIMGGGCSGLQYSLGLDAEFNPKNDVRFEQEGGVSVVTEKKFDLHLDGTEIDFLDTPTARGFSIENPNYPKGAGCAGCGGY
ncbi:MAG: iron-sulfur cluster assembly accessory protein [Planctomycetaceae bacterium]|nr:iron-sulfur cluster assembly accessory protein [Planctomycetaceae bacterium]